MFFKQKIKFVFNDVSLNFQAIIYESRIFFFFSGPAHSSLVAKFFGDFFFTFTPPPLVSGRATKKITKNFLRLPLRTFNYQKSKCTIKSRYSIHIVFSLLLLT